MQTYVTIAYHRHQLWDFGTKLSTTLRIFPGSSSGLRTCLSLGSCQSVCRVSIVRAVSVRVGVGEFRNNKLHMHTHCMQRIFPSSERKTCGLVRAI